ncbi:hypothetical protein [Polyangium aurulentum]|uniref:hypothetical protein n=1 Tax=Polyangium aurulentum TaxID=2567896 RepID=UPI0010AE978B|nr:hypothetical protein [Polyangium aurulentum]UQA55573.1 hypothetical protein E8A73_030050 [Polyangium aurulentum]
MPSARARLKTSPLALLVLVALACCGEDAPGPDGAGGSGGAGGAGVGGAGGGALLCEPWAKRPCYTGPPETMDVGACSHGFFICNAAGTGWSFCEAEITPLAEDCATPADDDCDGTANEGCARTLAPRAYGTARFAASCP